MNRRRRADDAASAPGAGDVVIPAAVRPRRGVVMGGGLAVAVLVVGAMFTSKDGREPADPEPRRLRPPAAETQRLPFVDAAEEELAREAAERDASQTSSYPHIPVGEAGRPYQEFYGTASTQSGSDEYRKEILDARRSEFRNAMQAPAVEEFADPYSVRHAMITESSAQSPSLAADLDDVPEVSDAGSDRSAGRFSFGSSSSAGHGPEGMQQSANGAAWVTEAQTRSLTPTPGSGPIRSGDGQTSSSGSIPLHRLAARTLISGTLITAVNSDLSGQLTAQVTRDVYDDAIQHVLVPRGSFLTGNYSDQVALGTDRLLVAWTQLDLPDGTVYQLPGLKIADPEGAGGVPGKVDNHYGQVFGSAALLSVISAGLQMSQPPHRDRYAATSGEQMAGALGLELGRVATEIVRRNLSIMPTITVPQGTEFRVFVGQDILLPPYRRK